MAQIDVLKAQIVRNTLSTPWGFRLQGGAEHGQALSLMRVTPGSPAARIGLKSGDEVTEIGDVPTENMSQQEAYQHINQYGESLILTVERRASGRIPTNPIVTPGEEHRAKSYEPYDMAKPPSLRQPRRNPLQNPAPPPPLPEPTMVGGLVGFIQVAQPGRPPSPPPQPKNYQTYDFNRPTRQGPPPRPKAYDYDFQTVQARPYEQPVSRPVYQTSPQQQPPPPQSPTNQQQPSSPSHMPVTDSPHYSNYEFGDAPDGSVSQSRTFKVLQSLMEGEANDTEGSSAPDPTNPDPTHQGADGPGGQLLDGPAEQVADLQQQLQTASQRAREPTNNDKDSSKRLDGDEGKESTGEPHSAEKKPTMPWHQAVRRVSRERKASGDMKSSLERRPSVDASTGAPRTRLNYRRYSQQIMMAGGPAECSFIKPDSGFKHILEDSKLVGPGGRKMSRRFSHDEGGSFPGLAEFQARYHSLQSRTSSVDCDDDDSDDALEPYIGPQNLSRSQSLDPHHGDTTDDDEDSSRRHSEVQDDIIEEEDDVMTLGLNNDDDDDDSDTDMIWIHDDSVHQYTRSPRSVAERAAAELSGENQGSTTTPASQYILPPDLCAQLQVAPDDVDSDTCQESGPAETYTSSISVKILLSESKENTPQGKPVSRLHVVKSQNEA